MICASNPVRACRAQSARKVSRQILLYRSLYRPSAFQHAGQSSQMPVRAPSPVRPCQVPSGRMFRHRPDNCRALDKFALQLEDHPAMVCASAFRTRHPAPVKAFFQNGLQPQRVKLRSPPAPVRIARSCGLSFLTKRHAGDAGAIPAVHAKVDNGVPPGDFGFLCTQFRRLFSDERAQCQ